MTSNLYFAYSIKRDYNGLASLPPTILPPINEKKKRKTRACDACSVRKTKCDDTRPCRHCVNNNLECTELRQRKKSGPKNLRKKTIDSIQSISKDSTSKSPERDDSARSSESSLSGQSIDLDTVAEHLRTVPVEVLEVTAAFTVTSISTSISEAVMRLSTTPTAGAGLGAVAKRLATLSYVSLILSAVKTPLEREISEMESPKVERYLGSQLQNHISVLFSDCIKLLFFLDSNSVDFEASYHLALANLHMYAIMKSGPTTHAGELIYLRSAISHFQLLVAHYGKEDVYMKNLHRLLFVWERHAVLFSLEPAFRTTSVLVNLLTPETGGYPQNIVEAYHAMVTVLDELLVFEHAVSEPYTWIYQSEPTGMALSYSTAKAKLNDLLGNIGRGGVAFASVARLLNFMVSLKAIQVFLKELTQEYVALELIEVIRQANVTLNPTDPFLRIYMDVLGVVPLMLEALRAYLQVTAGEQLGPHIIDALLQLSSCISFYMDHTFEIHDPILSDWFSRLIGPQQQQFPVEVFQ